MKAFKRYKKLMANHGKLSSRERYRRDALFSKITTKEWPLQVNSLKDTSLFSAAGNILVGDHREN